MKRVLCIVTNTTYDDVRCEVALTIRPVDDAPFSVATVYAPSSYATEAIIGSGNGNHWEDIKGCKVWVYATGDAAAGENAVFWHPENWSPFDIHENSKQWERPPVGLMPRHIWLAKRRTGIVKAMGRYIEIKKPIPVEWAEELKWCLGALANEGE